MILKVCTKKKCNVVPYAQVIWMFSHIRMVFYHSSISMQNFNIQIAHGAMSKVFFMKFYYTLCIWFYETAITLFWFHSFHFVIIILGLWKNSCWLNCSCSLLTLSYTFLPWYIILNYALFHKKKGRKDNAFIRFEILFFCDRYYWSHIQPYI